MLYYECLQADSDSIDDVLHFYNKHFVDWFTNNIVLVSTGCFYNDDVAVLNEANVMKDSTVTTAPAFNNKSKDVANINFSLTTNASKGTKDKVDAFVISIRYL